MSVVLNEEQALLQANVRKWLRENVTPRIDAHEAERTFRC